MNPLALLAVAVGLIPSAAVGASGKPLALERLTAPPGPRYALARVRPGKRVELRSAPNGPVVRTVGATTEFGSTRSYYVARFRDGWLGVPSAALPNDRLAWIRDDPAQIETEQTSYSIRVDLSLREVGLFYGDKLLKLIPVSIGRPGSETPPGTFAVTDGLVGRHVGRYYGCCVLALSGHQPNLPPGWIGGDRIAIHGTPGPTGLAASGGCLRASNDDMVALFALVPLGTPVFIRA